MPHRPRLLQAGFEVLRHVLICLEVFSAIPFAKFEGVHQSILQLFCKSQGCLDIFVLSSFVATCEQDHDLRTTLS